MNVYILISSVADVSVDAASGTQDDDDLAEVIAEECRRYADGLHDLTGCTFAELVVVVARLLGEVDWLTAKVTALQAAAVERQS